MVTAEAQISGEARARLIELIAAGRHQEAVSACVREYGGKLGQFCFSLLGSQEEAEEALQETLLGAYRGMASFRGEGSPKGWLYGIARRQCARRLELRRGQRKAQLQLVVERGSTAGSVAAPEDLLRQQRRAASVRRALALLKPSEREAIVLRYQAELSYRDVGIAVGVEEATARKRVSRALESLRNVLQVEELE
jgi:RNA polymerase sigma-70 factor (ECF subfamily)